MPKKNTKKPPTQKPSPPTPQPSPQKSTTMSTTLAETTQTLIKQLHELHSEAKNSMTTDADIKWWKSLKLPNQPDLFELCKEAYEASEIFRRQTENAKQAEQEAQKTINDLKLEKAKLSEEERDIVSDREEFTRDAKLLKEERSQLEQREQELLAKDENLKKRELDAEAGFIELRKASLDKLNEQAANLGEEITQHRAKIAQERSEWLEQQRQAQQESDAKLAEKLKEHETQLEQVRIKVEAELQAKKEELVQEQQNLDSEQKSQRRERKQLELEKELLEEDKQDFDQRVAQKAAREIETLSFQIDDLTARLAEARTERDELAATLREREKVDLRFGHKTPEEVLQELQALRKERDDLNEQLIARPSHQTLEKLRQLEADKETYELQREAELVEMASLKSQLRRSSVSVIELETLKDQKAALESSRELTKAALDELQKDVKEIIERDKAQSSFPQCSQMDKNEGLQNIPALVEKIPDLAVFAKELQQRMAYDPNTKKELYYELSDIQCFLGGLAMTHLHLLQGISGIGKTSLPLAFARAIGAGSTLVEVQAGWRDRQDLIGYYNTFEKRFNETEFLQALYRAQCPSYTERLYIIVLDEMNLSHPEQYFADLLSVLEQDESQRDLKLMSASANAAPKLLKEGRILKMPANVWFIGTANHDETTKDFADKTYDRAHIMELPHQYKKFENNKSPDPAPLISVTALKNAFAKAQQAHIKEAEQVSKFFQAPELKNLLYQFKIGWGNRLQRQISSYVPVVIAAGASIGAATDHLLATKLLRKLKGRYSNEEKHLKSLQEYLNSEKWLNSKQLPVKSLEIIATELQHFGETDKG